MRALVLLAACGTAGTREVPPPAPVLVAAAPRPDAAITPVDAAIAIDAEVPVDAPRAELVLPPSPPPTTGTHHSVRPKKAAKLPDGTAITWIKDEYKRTFRGGAGHTTVAIRRGTKRFERVLTSKGSVEVDAFGTTLVLYRNQDDMENVVVDVMVVGPTQKPLSNDEMTALIRERAIEWKLPLEGFQCRPSQGYFTCWADAASERRWQARMGVYTRRIVFYRPDPRDVCEDNPLLRGC